MSLRSRARLALFNEPSVFKLMSAVAAVVVVDDADDGCELLANAFNMLNGIPPPPPPPPLPFFIELITLN